MEITALNGSDFDGIQQLTDIFDPAQFITWDINKSPWFVPRNWGAYS